MELTPEQKQKIIDIWNSLPEPPSIPALCIHIWGEKKDLYSEEVKILREFLASRQLVPREDKTKKSNTSKKTLQEIILTEEQKLYIKNNGSFMSSTEMAKEIFKNEKINSLYSETRKVNEYLKSLDIVPFNKKQEQDIPQNNYIPPQNLDQTLRKVNKFINDQLDKSKLSPHSKKGLEKLIDYLHTHRLIIQINNYGSESDRELFEDAFIRYTYDKPDLSQEEIDQYISLSHEGVVAFRIQKRVEDLQKLLTEATNAQEGDYVKISMSLNEAIKNAQDDYDKCVKRQNNYLDDLKEKRSNRIKKELHENASVLNLLNLWREEESRKKMLEVARKRQEALGNELAKMDTMEELKLKLLGLNPDQILYGTL